MDNLKHKLYGCREKCEKIPTILFKSHKATSRDMKNFKGLPTSKSLRIRIKRLFPFYRWLRTYNSQDFIFDLIAGLTVGLTVVPQSLAYATIAGLPIQYGLYSSFMGAFIYALLGTSKDITFGPTAVMSLLTYQYTAQHINMDRFHLKNTSPTKNIINESSNFNNYANSTTFNVINNEQNMMLELYKIELKNALLVHYAIVLTLITGLMQIIMGFLNLGFLISFISHPVLYGFTNAAAIIIGVGQIGNILGIKTKKSTFLPQFWEVLTNLKKANPWDCLLGISSLIILILMKKLNRSDWFKRVLLPKTQHQQKNKINDVTNNDDQLFVNTIINDVTNNDHQLFVSKTLGSGGSCLNLWCRKIAMKFIWLILTGRNAFVIAISAVIAYFMVHNLGLKLSLTQSINDRIPEWKMPRLDFNFKSFNGQETTGFPAKNQQTDIHIPGIQVLKDIGFGFVTIALIGILESLAIAKAFARKYKYTIDSTQEFIALGASNFFSSFVSSYPITASFSRSAINAQTGVRTPCGCVWTGILVLIALQYLTTYFRFIPKASLAAMIISAILNLIDLKLFYKIWKIKKCDFIAAMVTLLVCFFYSVETGLMVGIGLALAFLVYPISKPHLDLQYFSSETNAPSPLSENVNYPWAYYIVCPNQSLFYPSSEYFSETIISQCLLKPQLLSNDTIKTDDTKNKFTQFTNNEENFVGDQTKIHLTSVLTEQNNFKDDMQNTAKINGTPKFGGPFTKYLPFKTQKQGKNICATTSAHLKGKCHMAKTQLADVIVDCSHMQNFDYSIIQEFKELHREFKSLNKELVLCNINILLRQNLGTKLKHIRTFEHISDAKEYLTNKSSHGMVKKSSKSDAACLNTNYRIAENDINNFKTQEKENPNVVINDNEPRDTNIILEQNDDLSSLEGENDDSIEIITGTSLRI